MTAAQTRRCSATIWSALSLTDPQQATRIAMDTSGYYVPVAHPRRRGGERIVIHSSQPNRWARLAQPQLIAVVDRRRPAVRALDHRQRPAPHCAAHRLSATVITSGVPSLAGSNPTSTSSRSRGNRCGISTARDTVEVAIVAFQPGTGLAWP